ncbi:MAG: protein kinase [Deltaproteobacteria bacterium]
MRFRSAPTSRGSFADSCRTIGDALTNATDKYELGERLGGGGMAEVYRGTQRGAEGFSKTVAVKRVLPGYSNDPQFAEMFVSEATIASRLMHPNVVAVTDFDRDTAGRLFLVMELIEGRDLRALMTTGRLPPTIVVYIVSELLRALGYAHALHHDGRPMQIVHRDVSPHNVLVSWDGAVKLSDFGIAKAAEASPATRTGVVKGKAAYLSPEQARAESLDHRSDLFAAGVVLYELLTDKRLFAVQGGAREAVIIHRVLNLEYRSPREIHEDISESLDGVCRWLLARDRDQRPADAFEALDALLACPEASARGARALAEVMRERFPRDAPSLTTPAHSGPIYETPSKPPVGDFTDSEIDAREAAYNLRSIAVDPVARVPTRTEPTPGAPGRDAAPGAWVPGPDAGPGAAGAPGPRSAGGRAPGSAGAPASGSAGAPGPRSGGAPSPGSGGSPGPRSGGAPSPGSAGVPASGSAGARSPGSAGAQAPRSGGAPSPGSADERERRTPEFRSGGDHFGAPPADARRTSGHAPRALPRGDAAGDARASAPGPRGPASAGERPGERITSGPADAASARGGAPSGSAPRGAPALGSGRGASAPSSGPGAPGFGSGPGAPAPTSAHGAPASGSGPGAHASSSGHRAPESGAGRGAHAPSSGLGASESGAGRGAPTPSSGQRAPAPGAAQEAAAGHHDAAHAARSESTTTPVPTPGASAAPESTAGGRRSDRISGPTVVRDAAPASRWADSATRPTAPGSLVPGTLVDSAPTRHTPAPVAAPPRRAWWAAFVALAVAAVGLGYLNWRPTEDERAPQADEGAQEREAPTSLGAAPDPQIPSTRGTTEAPTSDRDPNAATPRTNAIEGAPRTSDRDSTAPRPTVTSPRGTASGGRDQGGPAKRRRADDAPDSSDTTKPASPKTPPDPTTKKRTDDSASSTRTTRRRRRTEPPPPPPPEPAPPTKPKKVGDDLLSPDL